VVTETLSESRDGQNEPVPANALTYEDRRKLNRLMAVYARAAFSNDVNGIGEIFSFESEAQKKRVLDMIGQEKPLSSPTDDKTPPVYVVQIDPLADNGARVSALCPLGRHYIAHSVTWIRTDRGWKVSMDLTRVMETREQVETMGAEAYGRLQLKTQLESWENAQGPVLASLYEDAKRQAQFRVQAMQFAKLKALSMQGHVTETQNQEQLDQIRGKSPEAYRRD
ncbi:MAG: hypothetical protein GY809_32310, partial [Planctomycetes bacterium]|nr:hypothetical protein [Planctomycetota bacterium]